MQQTQAVQRHENKEQIELLTTTCETSAVGDAAWDHCCCFYSF